MLPKLHILAVAIVLLLSACTPFPTTPIGQANLLSPDKIAENIQENGFLGLKDTWQQLGVSPPDYLFRDRDKLSFSVQRFYFEGNNGDEYAMVIVRENDFKWDWQYLLFRSNGTHWEFLGNVDLDMQKYFVEPSYRIITHDKQNVWLVVRSLTGSGTGFVLYGEIWYRLNGKGLEVVLRYPVDGHIGSLTSPANVEFEGEITGYSQEGDTYTIALLFETSYGGYGKEEGGYPLFSTKQMAYYNWNSERNLFLLDAEKSEVTQEQIDKEFYYRSDEFLRYTYDELLQLAKNGNELQIEWLRKLLDEVEDSAEKQALLRVLNAS